MAIDENIVIDRTAKQLVNAIDITNGASATGENSTALGKQSEAVGRYSVAIGYDAETTNTEDIAIGAGARANLGIAIGAGANATALGTIQIDEGTNNSAETVKIKNTTILDATGKIPFSALQSGEVVGLAVNSNNHLIVTYADGTTADLGAIGGGGGTSNYTQLTNKPSINGETLTGNKTSKDLKLLTVELLPDKFLQYEGGYLEDMFDDASLPSGIFTVAENEMFSFTTNDGVDDEYHAVTDKSIFFFNKESLNACLIGGENPFYVVGGTGGSIVTRYDLLGRTDDMPTAKSTNFVTSAGVKTYVDTAVGNIDTALQGLISGGGVV